MPIYEFLCPRCQKKFSLLCRKWEESSCTQCPDCGSHDVERLLSGFAYHKSTATIQEESGEPQMFPKPDYYQDPRNIGRWTEKRFKELGMEVPSQIREEIDAAREGELPKSLKDNL